MGIAIALRDDYDGPFCGVWRRPSVLNQSKLEGTGFSVWCELARL